MFEKQTSPTVTRHPVPRLGKTPAAIHTARRLGLLIRPTCGAGVPPASSAMYAAIAHQQAQPHVLQSSTPLPQHKNPTRPRRPPCNLQPRQRRRENSPQRRPRGQVVGPRAQKCQSRGSGAGSVRPPNAPLLLLARHLRSLPRRFLVCVNKLAESPSTVAAPPDPFAVLQIRQQCPVPSASFSCGSSVRSQPTAQTQRVKPWVAQSPLLSSCGSSARGVHRYSAGSITLPPTHQLPAQLPSAVVQSPVFSGESGALVNAG
jgi:hypothetical protein